jgi:hypothetical protein
VYLEINATNKMWQSCLKIVFIHLLSFTQKGSCKVTFYAASKLHNEFKAALESDGLLWLLWWLLWLLRMQVLGSIGIGLTTEEDFEEV